MTTRKLKVESATREENGPTVKVTFNRPLSQLEFIGLIRQLEQSIGQK